MPNFESTVGLQNSGWSIMQKYNPRCILYTAFISLCFNAIQNMWVLHKCKVDIS